MVTVHAAAAGGEPARGLGLERGRRLGLGRRAGLADRALQQLHPALSARLAAPAGAGSAALPITAGRLAPCVTGRLACVSPPHSAQ